MKQLLFLEFLQNYLEQVFDYEAVFIFRNA